MRPWGAVASVFVVLSAAACGNAKDLLADAFQQPAEAPIPIDAATHGNFTAETRDVRTGTYALSANVPITVFSPDGTVTAELMSDSNGMVSGDIDAGGTVVASYLDGASRHEEFVITGVQIGDALVFGATPPAAAAGTFDVIFPLYSASYTYEVYGPCGSVSGTPGVAAKIPFYADCHPDNFDVFVVARNGNSTVVLTQSNVARTSNTITLPANWQGGSYMQFTATDLPDGAQASFSRYTDGAQSSFEGRYSVYANATANLGVASTYVYGAVLGGTQAWVTTEVQAASPTISSDRLNVERIQPFSQSYQMSAHDLLPALKSLTYDRPSRKITAALDGEGTGLDLALLAVEDGTGTTDVEWIVCSPATMLSVALPKMPDHLNIPPPPDADALSLLAYLLDTPDEDPGGAKHAREIPLQILQDVVNANTTGRSRVVAGSIDVPGVAP